MPRFYATGAPEWWPFQLVSLGNKVLPPTRRDYYYVLVDNGMFAYHKQGTRPDLDVWYARLLLFVRDLERLRSPREIMVVLPDWLHDPDFVLKAATHPRAKSLCKGYRCMAVAHASPLFIKGYDAIASELASIDHVSAIAAPLKLNCSRYSSRAGRRIIRPECQAAIVEQVCSVARQHNLHCHGLGILLRPAHVARLVRKGLDSFDSTSWTRPNASVIAKTIGRWSAKNKTEKEVFFTLVLTRLHEAGVELEGWNPSHTPNPLQAQDVFSKTHPHEG